MPFDLDGDMLRRVMYARMVDDAAARLRELHHEEWEDLGLAGVVLALAVSATEVRPPLAVPLFVGGLTVGVRGVRALWRRWDLVDRLSGERDAYVIPEVLAYASRESTYERRQSLAGAIRDMLGAPDAASPRRVGFAAEELEALASELDDSRLQLDPACAVACARLVHELDIGPRVDPAIAPAEVRSRVRQVRSGFTLGGPGQRTRRRSRFRFN